MDYDKIQRKLVIKSEKAHMYGVRGTMLSGQVNEKLLRHLLSKECRNLSFDSGAVTLVPLKELRKHGGPRGNKRSRQIDIIVYRGKPKWRLDDVISIPRKQVILSIEVKKWITANQRSWKSINKIIYDLKKVLGRPVIFVAFRHHGNFDKIKKLSKADETYIFSRKTNGYPWEDHSDWLYHGELGKLIETVKKVEFKSRIH